LRYGYTVVVVDVLVDDEVVVDVDELVEVVVVLVEVEVVVVDELVDVVVLKFKVCQAVPFHLLS